MGNWLNGAFKVTVKVVSSTTARPVISFVVTFLQSDGFNAS